MSILDDSTINSKISPPNSHGTVLAIGTFDQFLTGQRHILKAAAKLARDRIIVGVCDVPKKGISKDATSAIRAVNLKLLVEAEPTVDPYCLSIYHDSLEAILVSKETLADAMSINKKRGKKGLSQLKIEIVDLLTGSLVEMR